ncbi:MAG: hypothetical protein Q8K66_12550 [Sediminibacterium sp.]|nr:hypothetical protein [Sediminibacterium sp.]
MQAKKIIQPIIIILALSAYMIMVGYIRDSLIDPQHKLLVNLISTGLLVCGVIAKLYFKEKNKDKPNYKSYFYSTLFIFLFVTIALLMLRK